jgi:hypothetical protein
MKTDGWSDYIFETYVNTDGWKKQVRCTPPQWDLSTYEVSCWHLKDFSSYAPLTWKIKYDK